jgi:hypothetical protein
VARTSTANYDENLFSGDCKENLFSEDYDLLGEGSDNISCKSIIESFFSKYSSENIFVRVVYESIFSGTLSSRSFSAGASTIASSWGLPTRAPSLWSSWDTWKRDCLRSMEGC